MIWRLAVGRRSDDRHGIRGIHDNLYMTHSPLRRRWRKRLSTIAPWLMSRRARCWTLSSRKRCLTYAPIHARGLHSINGGTTPLKDVAAPTYLPSVSTKKLIRALYMKAGGTVSYQTFDKLWLRDCPDVIISFLSS